MLFSSTLFLFAFLPLVLGGYFVIHPALRNLWLLVASLVFYSWGEPVVVVVMLASIIANWGLGLWVARDRRGKLPLIATLTVNLGMLVVFKYADWLTDTASSLLVAVGVRETGLPYLGSLFAEGSAVRTWLTLPTGELRLPLGISFFTFQALSYVIDVRRGEVPAQRDPLAVALYVSFFPQLVAGPIVRYSDVDEQIRSRTVTLAGFASGVRRFIGGLAKKVLIANTAAATADAIFAIPSADLPPTVAWLGIVCYTAQIYFDFSGYSDMAIGLGAMFGFRFRENFDHPYVAQSITDFWRRWHRSLSTWFRDYLYIPLGGNRAGPLRTYFNLITVFVLCGLWHGASASFLIWGTFHGAFLVIERAGLARWLERRPRFLRHAYALLVVMVGWVFFRAETSERAIEYLRAMAWLQPGAAVLHPVSYYCETPLLLALAAAVVCSTPFHEWIVRRCASSSDRYRYPAETVLRIGGVVALFAAFALSCLWLAAGTYNPFIYFRF